MTHPLRVRRYDKEPDAITRPDIVPAALRFAEHAASSSEHEPPKLGFYKALPHADELTVQYTALQRVPTSASCDAEERSASDVTSEPRSGTRLTATTVPPPRRARLKLQPLANDGARSDAPSTPLSQVPTIASPALAAPRRKSRALLLCAVTAISAAGFGASLGNGSLARALGRLSGTPAETLLVSTPVMPTSPPRSTHTAPSPSPPPAATSEAITVPVVRLQDLPPVEQDSPASKRKRSGKRR